MDINHVKRQLEILNENFQNQNYLLAVSGGVDSMVLADLFYQLKLNFQIAHINYKLRANDSDLDEKLVNDFCQKRQIKFHLYRVSEQDDLPKNSIQEWARNLRYDFFYKIKKEENLDLIVTAHHLNDNVETFFIHLSRGSGIKGLSGIPNQSENILRPLLTFKKEEIYAFAKSEKIDFREDKSNAKNDYLRNQWRNIILPKIEETQPLLMENIGKSLTYLNDAKHFIEEQIQSILNEITVAKNENLLVLDKEKLAQKSPFIQFEILRRFGFHQPKEIQKIFTAETGKHFYSENFILEIRTDKLEFRSKNREARIKSQEPRVESREKIMLAEEKEDLEAMNFIISLSDFIEIEDDFSWNFDLEKIHFPLFLRKKKNGDFFFPIGMNGKKKISKFFKDKKMSIFAKENCWLLCDGNGILGIPPFRQDRRKVADKKYFKNNELIIKE